MKEKLFVALRSTVANALGLVRELLEHEKNTFRNELKQLTHIKSGQIS